MMYLKHAAIIGGTGYGALELIRLLQNHPEVTIKKIISHSQEGEYLENTYPHLASFLEGPMETFEAESLVNDVDIIFFATPPGVSKNYIPQLAGTSVQCIDLSGDLRLEKPENYEKWYGKTPAPQEILDEAVYGLSEIYESELKKAKICSNPGCYPTASLLGLMPAITHKLIDNESIIIDGKTGVSGAGRTMSPMTHFSETNENVKPYKIGRHQHIPEIEQYLGKEAGKPVCINMTTHLLPMTRGLLCTMYGKLATQLNTKEAIEIYSEYYEADPFVRIRPEGTFPSTKEVSGSNFCDIGLYADDRTNQLVIVSAIDNLVKGASGQAIQNMNIMNGWQTDKGLKQVPVYP
ncbi:N-acetyl-gamma-glutamyl-phosphate reductase [Salipaludibacillus aurantiacus]|nr:N-acetyl-gamma-glutamyl-phosphate reductase [Salipaludibacillus aurantiacus]